MTNQYALGYKAGLEAAVKVCRRQSEEAPICEWDWGYTQAAINLMLEIEALPVPGE